MKKKKKKKMDKKKDKYLSEIYYDPKRTGGFGGFERLYQNVKKDGNTIFPETI